MAKVPIPGQVKTRLAATEGPVRAAQLATAALLDTLAVCEDVFGSGRRHIWFAGDLAELRDPVLVARLRSWAVHRQWGTGLGERIANSHRALHRTAGGPVVQIGMDTPHATAAVLDSVATMAATLRPVLGLAADGGWWVLATGAASQVDGLDRVPMSTAQTGRLTWELLRRGGEVAAAPTMRDVDEEADAEHVAALAPLTRFARAWRARSEP